MVAGSITVVQMLPELESGGVERGTLELGRYLSAHGHQSVVISAGGRMVPKLEREGSRHIFWKVGRKGPTTLQYIWPLRRFLIREKVDILHLRSRLPAWVGYLAWKSLPKNNRPKLVTTFHGFYSVNAYSAVMAKGERIIAISKTIGDHIREVYKVYGGRITVIYRGFDETAFDPESVNQQSIAKLRREWKISTLNVPVVMLPARLTRIKGHDFLFKSLALIKHLPWVAVCVGDINPTSSYPPMLKKMISELELEERIRLVGHCNDMPAALMLADIVVSTSRQPEAFGRTLIEAQAMAKPVIATAHGGSLEIVLDNRTGWLVPPGDIENFANVLKNAILNQDLREALGGFGQQWVRKTFTTNTMCRKTVGLYHELLQ